MIVITTPTGTVGRQVLDKVLAHTSGSGERVRVIARDPSRLAPAVRDRVEVVRGSMADPAVVTRAFEGADALFWLVPPYASTGDVQEYTLNLTRPACEAIVRHGVKRVTAVSSLGRRRANGAAGPFAPAFAMDALIESTGAGYRALRMPGFMENMLQQVQPIKRQGVFSLPVAADRRFPVCATRDIAAVAAGVLLDGGWTGQGDIPVLGPEDLSYDDMARIMSEVLERPVRYQQVSAEAYRNTLLRHGMNDAWAQRVVDMLTLIDQGFYDGEPRTPQATTPTGFRQWCQEVLRPAVAA